eukprot:3230373-Rhodomonas_salina.6
MREWPNPDHRCTALAQQVFSYAMSGIDTRAGITALCDVRYWPRRSTGWRRLAAILYVVLFFVPDILEKVPLSPYALAVRCPVLVWAKRCVEAAAMREIVDKHFSDNWGRTRYQPTRALRNARC